MIDVSPSSRSFGPGVCEALGGAELVEFGRDCGVELLRAEGEHDRALLHQRHPDTTSLIEEADRLLWLDGRSPAPLVVASARADNGDESVVIGLGRQAVSADLGHPLGPEALATATAAALRRLHDLDVTNCPMRADTATLRSVVAERLARGEVTVATDGPYRGRSPGELATIFDGLAEEFGEPADPVFVHGALRASRIWLDPAGEVRILGWHRAGVGDRHVDLAAAATMLSELHGPALVGPFFEAYGFDLVDLRRLDAHQLLVHLLG